MPGATISDAADFRSTPLSWDSDLLLRSVKCDEVTVSWRYCSRASMHAVCCTTPFPEAEPAVTCTCCLAQETKSAAANGKDVGI